jgi:carboxyl-terminal processing protease
MPRSDILKPIVFSRLILALVVVCAAGAFADNPPISTGAKHDIVDGIVDTLEHDAYVPGVDFNKVSDLLAAQKPDIDKAITNDDFKDAVNAALRKLGISHDVLYTPDMLAQRRSQTSIGIGVQVSLKDHQLNISRVLPNTPAADAGLMPGDAVVAVNGVPPEMLTSMSGPEGEQVTITVLTFEGKTRIITLTRRRFSTSLPATLDWPDHRTAVLTIPTFDMSYDRDHVEELVRQATAGDYLIIDLRNNPGGVVGNLTHMLGLFIPSDKPIGTFITKRMVNQFVTETKGDPNNLAAIASWSKQKMRPTHNKILYTGHVVVLIDHFSGSAAEMAAIALKEVDGATVIGERSAGKVLISILGDLPHGFEIQYPIMDYITVGGKRLEGAGVTPDISVKDPKVIRRDVLDEPLQTAIGLAKNPTAGGVAVTPQPSKS